MKYLKLYESVEDNKSYDNFNDILTNALHIFERKIIKYNNTPSDYIIELNDQMGSFYDDEYEYEIGDPETKKAWDDNEINKNELHLIHYVTITKRDKTHFNGGDNSGYSIDTIKHISEINKVMEFVKTFITNNPKLGTYGLTINNKSVSLSVTFNLKDHFNNIDNALLNINK